jgi:hypothetical protein
MFIVFSLSETKGGENTMDFKIVKLLLLSALFFAILFATPMLMANPHTNAMVDNLTNKLATEGHAHVVLTGDPVGGGFPQAVIPMGDPVGGGFPLVRTKAD